MPGAKCGKKRKRCQARENQVQLVRSTGKFVTDAKGGKTERAF